MILVLPAASSSTSTHTEIDSTKLTSFSWFSSSDDKSMSWSVLFKLWICQRQTQWSLNCRQPHTIYLLNEIDCHLNRNKFLLVKYWYCFTVMWYMEFRSEDNLAVLKILSGKTTFITLLTHRELKHCSSQSRAVTRGNVVKSIAWNPVAKHKFSIDKIYRNFSCFDFKNPWVSGKSFWQVRCKTSQHDSYDEK